MRPPIEGAARRSQGAPAGPSPGASSRPSQFFREIEVFVEGRNLFDRRYATRGIYALDFTTFTNSVFVTPAPGRTFVGGASVTF